MLTAIIVAAGSSRRMGSDKLFAEIAGRPVVAHSIAAFQESKSVGEIIVVAREDRHRQMEKLVSDGNFSKVRSIVSGGEHRHDSVRSGLAQLGSDVTYVSVHDAARPLVTPQQIESLYERARVTGAATLAEPIRDTIKRADTDLNVAGSVDRHHMYAMQTPQIFERKLLEDAYRVVSGKKVSVTDEVSAVELTGHKVALVVNEQCNLKITYPYDLRLAEFILQQAKR
jgi:2-C-methyl-D-erythritol 4-phosphate cytidylyltransferase